VGLIVAIYLFWIFTIGIGFLEYTKNKNKNHVIKAIGWEMLKNPLLLAVVAGILVAYLHITIPNVLMKSIDMLATSVTPVVLVVIGLFIGKSRIGKIKEWIPVALFSLSTLMIIPACFYLIFIKSGLTTPDFFASLIVAAMPVAITPFALADKYDLHKTFIARSIVLSTILSAVSIPFWISINI